MAWIKRSKGKRLQSDLSDLLPWGYAHIIKNIGLATKMNVLKNILVQLRGNVRKKATTIK